MSLKEANRMMSDDTDMDEEIERQMEADVHDTNYIEQSLLNDKELDVSDLFPNILTVLILFNILFAISMYYFLEDI